MPAPRALTPEQRQLLHAWFRAGAGERVATRRAREAGWQVGHTTIGAELRLFRAGATTPLAPAGPASTPPSPAAEVSVSEARRRALAVLVALAEDPGAEARIRVDASRAILRDAQEDDGEGAPGVPAAGKPFVVETRN